MNQRSEEKIIRRQKTYQANCFCGRVKIELTGEPEAQGVCHCDSCRRWSAGSMNSFTLWKPQNVKLTCGEDLVAGFDGNPGSDHEGVVSNRKWCRHCGGHVFVEHPGMGLIDVPAAVIADFDFTPGFHVHYQETVHRVEDGLVKYRDLPAAAGGSGIELPE